jgi:hypothetical protein
MVSDWTDQILLSCDARGCFTVLGRKYMAKDLDRPDRGYRLFGDKISNPPPLAPMRTVSLAKAELSKAQ